MNIFVTTLVDNFIKENAIKSFFLKKRANRKRRDLQYTYYNVYNKIHKNSNCIYIIDIIFYVIFVKITFFALNYSQYLCISQCHRHLT